MRTAFPVAALIAMTVNACGGGEAQWTGMTYDSAGVTVVSNPSVGLWGPGDEWTFEEELRIGAVEGDPNYLFGAIGGVAVDTRGRIFVLDRQADHVQVYSPDGVYEMTVGGPGEGPGEMGRPFAALMGPDDTLLVPDVGNMRVNLFAPDGSSAGSFRLLVEKGRLLGLRATSTGGVAQHLRFSEYFGSDGEKTPTDVILSTDRDGMVTDTLMIFPPGEMFFDGGIKVYAPEPVWTLTDDSQLVFGVNSEYRIGFYSGRELKRLVEIPFERTWVSDREKDVIMRVMEGVWTDAGFSPDQLKQAASAWQFAEFFPAFRAVEVGPMRTTWVRHIQRISELTDDELAALSNPVNVGAKEWDVFDAEGRFLGVVTMPARFEPAVFGGYSVYGVWRDGQDVPYLVRLRIVGVPA